MMGEARGESFLDVTIGYYVDTEELAEMKLGIMAKEVEDSH